MAYTVVEERTGRPVARGALYTALERLEAKGCLSSHMGDPTAERGGKARRYFSVTPLGVAGDVLQDAMRQAVTTADPDQPIEMLATMEQVIRTKVTGISFFATVLVLAVVTMAAGFLPARRGSRQDPWVALRSDRRASSGRGRSLPAGLARGARRPSVRIRLTPYEHVETRPADRFPTFDCPVGRSDARRPVGSLQRKDRRPRRTLGHRLGRRRWP
ncbi:MAG: helix-turn-helix transcriptional regulator [Acidobacteriota bacterium]